MREKDYINATNLAKVRIAETVIRDILFGELAMDEEHATMMLQLRAWRGALERKVHDARP